MKDWVTKHWQGILLCLLITVPAWFLGKRFPIVGGAVIAIVAGMCVVPLIRTRRATLDTGIRWVSKKILQWAVVLLGFGMNLAVIAKTGIQSLPIIVSTVAISLIVAYVIQKWWKVPERISILVGVGSSICGGSAVAATAPVIEADDSEVAQAISVIFLFNVLAALIFPLFGTCLGMDATTGEVFGIFAGTAVNDTSSVTACASTWDSMYDLGTATLDKAVIVKLTRTLAIIPIVLGLTFIRVRQSASATGKVAIRKIFPFFIIWFVVAAIITTVLTTYCGVAEAAFSPIKTLSKFMVVMAMAAIGLNTDVVKLVKTGGKPIFLGAACWVSITGLALVMMAFLGLW